MTIRVYGLPVPQGRPRAFLPKGATRPSVFDPAGSRDWKRTVQAQALNLCPRPVPLEGPVRLGLVFFLPRPKSAPRRVTLPCKRPDVDNLAKAVKDALRAIAWGDDCQVVELRARKVFASQAEPPGVLIDVEAVA